MKLFEIIGYSIYLLGLVLKFMFVPFHELVMLLPLVYMFFMYAIMGFNMKVPTTRAAAGFASIFWGATYLFVIKFYPPDFLMAIVALIPTGIAIYYKVIRNSFFDIQTVIAFALLVASAVSYFMPSDKRYEIYYMLNNPNTETDFVLWDKYSWHLYDNGRTEEALEANQKSIEMVEGNDSKQWNDFINYHRFLIESDSWEYYHQTKIGDQEFQEELDN